MLKGVGYCLGGFREIFRSGVKRYLLLPVLANAAVAATLVTLGARYYDDLVRLVEQHTPEFLSEFLGWVLWAIFALAGLGLAGLTFVFASSLIAAPFYALLAEAVARNHRRDSRPGTSLVVTLLKLPLVIVKELWKITYVLLWGGLVFLLLLIPVINVAGVVIWFLYSAWAMALQYIDYPMDNDERSFAEMRRFVRRHLGQSLGFGAAALFLLTIPVLNLLAAPAAVAGATRFWIEYGEGFEKTSTD